MNTNNVKETAFDYSKSHAFSEGAAWMAGWILAITQMGSAIHKRELERRFDSLLGVGWRDEPETNPTIHQGPLVLSESTADAFFSDDDSP